MERFYTQEANGKSLPSVILNRPELFPDTIEYWVAFNELSTSRQSGMSIGYIPYAQISNYMDENEIYQLETRKEFRHIVSQLDIAYVAAITAKSERNNNLKKHKK